MAEVMSGHPDTGNWSTRHGTEVLRRWSKLLFRHGFLRSTTTHLWYSAGPSCCA